MLIWCAETTIVTGVLALLAHTIGRHRSASPSVRHALWLVVLIKFATPPLVSWPWAVDLPSFEWPSALPQMVAPAVVAANPAPMSIPDFPATEATPAGGWAEIAHAAEETHGALTDVELAALAPPMATTTEEAPPSRRIADAPGVAGEVPAASWRQSLPSVASIVPGLLIAWLVSSIAIAIGQATRILRFRRRVRGASTAPDFLNEEADRIGQCLGVTVPHLLMVDDLGTPMLWCLGRPQLLLPTRLVKTLPVEQWRGILTHELAHLRRRDHWVSRLELATGLIWWWNPVYWLTRVRLDAEAELACDAWVVWTLPKDRLSYAEVLFDICSTISQAKPMAPTLSAVGSGRFFERRLTMILNDRVPCRLSLLGVLAACLLLLAALPSWSAAQLVDFNHASKAFAAIAELPVGGALARPANDDDKNGKALLSSADDDDDDDANDDDDDDDEQDEAALARAKARAEAARARVEAIQRKLEAARARSEKRIKEMERDKAGQSKKPDADGRLDVDVAKLEKDLESKFGEGSEFAKKMEQLGEKIGKELDTKLGTGSEFEKQMEKLGESIGKEMEKQFGPGSDFVKQMEKLGKGLEAKFGEGSEFTEKMKAFGKEMEFKFGPGSEFEQKMRKFGEEMKAKHKADSEFAKKLQEKAVSSAKAAAKAYTDVSDGSRLRQIEKLEAQVAELMEQIKALKSQKDKQGKN
jgi:beta-lactamase regulating signal transducer with metallopeptidase domain